MSGASSKAAVNACPVAAPPVLLSVAANNVPAQLNSAVEPVMSMIEQLNTQIRQLDRTINQLCQCRYPEAQRLQTVTGVGPLTSLAYVLMIEDPNRFSKSRQVGAYIGLTPASGSIGPKR